MLSMRMFRLRKTKVTSFMKHLKKTHFLLLMLLTVIIGSWAFPKRFSDWYLFDTAPQVNLDNAVGVRQGSVNRIAGNGVKSITVNTTTINNVESVGATNILLQSKDGGLTWQDISKGLPELEQPDDFFAGESGLYLRVQDELYHSKGNLESPVWESENGLDMRSSSIVFNRSGVVAFNFEGQIFQKASSGKWLPAYSNFKKHLVQTVFEKSDGTLFIGTANGLYKSTDKGENWRQVHDGVMGVAESDGVLIATYSKGIQRSKDKGEPGIMRSADNGEHWESVISEGGVGIAVERIDGGFAAISYSHITKSRRIRISLDGGETWTAIDEGLQPSMNISSIKQVGKYLLCGHPDGIFRSSDMGKSWKLVHPAVDNAFKLSDMSWNVDPSREDRKVYKLFVSNNVLYAVMVNAGC